MGILSKLFNKKESEYTKYHFTTIPVVGTSYKQKEVKKIFEDIESYEAYLGFSTSELKNTFDEGDRIYEIPEGTKICGYCKLIPEPDNKFDSNAVMVLVDNIHVGYIPKEKCSYIKSILNNIKKIELEAYGGKYKEIYVDYDAFKKKIYTDKKDLGILLNIYYLDENNEK